MMRNEKEDTHNVFNNETSKKINNEPGTKCYYNIDKEIDNR